MQITTLLDSEKAIEHPEKSLNFFRSNRLTFLSRKPSNTLHDLARRRRAPARAQNMRKDELRRMEVNDPCETAYLFPFPPPANGSTAARRNRDAILSGTSRPQAGLLNLARNQHSCRGARGDARLPSPPPPRFARKLPNTVVLYGSRRRRRALHRVGRERRCPGLSGFIWLEIRIFCRKLRSHDQSYKRSLFSGY